MSGSVLNNIIALKLRCSAKENSIMSKFNLTCSEYKALLSLEKDETLPCKVLAAKMELSESRGNRVVNRLIKKGCFKVSYDKNDKRVVYISLNAKGQKVKAKIDNMLMECEKEIKSKLSSSEIDYFITILNKVNRVLVKN